ncbi:unnamed protein product [Schistosoma guineensis]|nr:unnamed protein product [Schistosoma guineensis]
MLCNFVSNTFDCLPLVFLFTTFEIIKSNLGLRNYSVRERPPIIGPLIESEMNYLKELKQSQEYLNERQHINLLNKELSERRMKWQSELGYITGSILSQLQIPIQADDINYDQHSDRLNNSLNRNNSYYLPSSIDEKIPFKMNNQISEKMNKNQNVLHEPLYSSKTGRLLPPTNDSRYTRTRNQSSYFISRLDWLAGDILNKKVVNDVNV